MAKFWEYFKKLEESPEEEAKLETEAAVRSITAFDRDVLSVNSLRRGMWVMTPDGVGIVEGVLNSTIVVMLVDDVGFNKQRQHYSPDKVGQAKLGQIPLNRRKDLDKAKAATLGYK